MKPIKFLEPEIAEKIEALTANFSDKDPIFKLVTLYNIFSTHDKTTLYNMLSIHNESKPFDEQTAHEIRDIIENHPEQLLLHFATYDPQNKNRTEYSPSAVYSYLKRKDSDIAFDLTLVDTHDLDYGDNEEDYIMSYLYGNPYDEDWQHNQKTEFKAIADAIKNNN